MPIQRIVRIVLIDNCSYTRFSVIFSNKCCNQSKKIMKFFSLRLWDQSSWVLASLMNQCLSFSVLF